MWNNPYLKLSFLLSFLATIGCEYNSDDKMQQLKALKGTWHCEEIEQNESWTYFNDTLMRGIGFSVEDGQNVKLETLAIHKRGSRIIYQAMVIGQNEGKTINFQLNPFVDTLFSFENLDHDFPQKVQYRFIDSNELEIGVLNRADEGKRYRFLKDPYSF